MGLLRVKATWSGQQIGAGVSTFHFANADNAGNATEMTTLGNAVRSLFTNAANFIPSSVIVSIDPEVEWVDETNGQITEVMVMGTAPASVTGTGAAASAAGVGGRVRWRTGGFRNGRRVVGTTFLVPMPAAGYDVDGTLTTACVTALTTAGNALLSAAGATTNPLVVWSRPSGPGAADGAYAPVISVQVPDKVAWLRTRKDN